MQESTIKSMETEINKNGMSCLKFTFVDDSTVSIPVNKEDAKKLESLMTASNMEETSTWK